MLAIQPGTRYCAEKELTAVCCRSCIGHTKYACCVMLQLEIFVLKHGSVDGLATSSIILYEVPSL